MKQDIVLSTSLLIDPSVEPLQTILTSYHGITHVPSELDGPALMVFVELQKCFQKAGKVAEGLLPNVFWGFQQCGYDANHVAAGLTKLRALDYIYYSDAGRLPLSEFTLGMSMKQQIWIRYTKKFTNLIVKNNTDGKIFLGNT
jgi:hypothetical protein